MPFSYCIIDGTFYSFCTTSCIHVNLTKIAFLLIEKLLLTPLYSSIFSFFRPAVSCRFRGAKIKPFISFHQIFREKNFEWILLLNGACFFTHIWENNSYQASRRRILHLNVSTSSYLTTRKNSSLSSSAILAVRSSSILSLSSLPLSKAGAKVHGLSSHPNFTTMPPVLNYAWSLIYSLYTKTRTAVFLSRQPIQEAKSLFMVVGFPFDDRHWAV